MMTLFDTDLKTLDLSYQNNGRTPPQTQCIGGAQFKSINGTTYGHVVRVYVHGWDPRYEQSTSRDAIEALVIQRAGNEDLKRLDGPWLRYKMFIVSSPDEVPCANTYDTKTHMANSTAAIAGALSHAPLSWADPTKYVPDGSGA